MAEVVIERYIAAPPEVVFAMFTDPARLVRWIGDSAELDPRPGGVFRFTLGDRDACRGRYLEVDAPRRVVFTWGWERGEEIPVPAGSTTVEVDLVAQGSGTHLRLVHRGLDGDAALLHEHGWRRFLDRLDAVTTGGDAGADPAVDEPATVLRQIKEGP
ncbi:MAG TPA: SRPBCC domain-containing protein [Euzebyales bacterium]|nr:SRPBCC domain-containing protein [Euzebyales bacterium]